MTVASMQPQTKPPVPVEFRRGRYFHFAIPAGWQVNENSNLICLNSPDGVAAIMSVGLAGMLQPVMPDQFVHYALNMHQMQDVRILAGQAVAPAQGFTHAGVFELAYVCNGVTCRGLVTCNVAVGYGQCNASLTLAAARAERWHEFRTWLPQIAAQVAPAGAQTFMAGRIASDNLQGSIELGHRFHEVNDYISQLHQQTVNERAASQDRINFQFRENLGNVVTYNHPFEQRTIELSAMHNHYWVNRAGQIVGSDDPSFDPRIGSTDQWVRMKPSRP